jgi:hypothetical protein
MAGSPQESAAGLRAPGPYEPNAFLRWVYRTFFAHISVDGHWSQSVEAAAKRGLTVYVMRSISVLDFVCIDYLTKQFALPLIRFVNDLGLGILEPFGKGRRRLRLRRQIPEDQALRVALQEKASALLFLRKPPRFGTAARHGRDLEVDLIRTLIELQRKRRCRSSSCRKPSSGRSAQRPANVPSWTCSLAHGSGRAACACCSSSC